MCARMAKFLMRRWAASPSAASALAGAGGLRLPAADRRLHGGASARTSVRLKPSNAAAIAYAAALQAKCGARLERKSISRVQETGRGSPAPGARSDSADRHISSGGGGGSSSNSKRHLYAELNNTAARDRLYRRSSDWPVLHARRPREELAVRSLFIARCGALAFARRRDGVLVGVRHGLEARGGGGGGLCLRAV